jgi:hypothetical protein
MTTSGGCAGSWLGVCNSQARQLAQSSGVCNVASRCYSLTTQCSSCALTHSTQAWRGLTGFPGRNCPAGTPGDAIVVASTTLPLPRNNTLSALPARLPSSTALSRQLQEPLAGLPLN